MLLDSLEFTYATPSTMGNVNVELLTGFWQRLELLPGAQVLPPSDDEVVVAALRGSTTRSGIAILIIDSIFPIIFDSAAAIRGPRLRIPAACRLYMFGAASLLPIVGLLMIWPSRTRQ